MTCFYHQVLPGLRMTPVEKCILLYSKEKVHWGFLAFHLFLANLQLVLPNLTTRLQDIVLLLTVLLYVLT